MEKIYVKKEDLNAEEKKTGKVSYKRLIDRYVGECILCNNIVDVDEFLFDNLNSNAFDEEENLVDIFQWFLCNLNDFEKEELEKCGIILTYSDVLDLDVLCVDHLGTSWDYVMTDVEWTTNYDDIKEEE